MKNARPASVARRALSLPGRALEWELLATPAPVLAAILTLVAAALCAALLVAGDLAGTNWSEGSESCGHFGFPFLFQTTSATLAVCLLVCQRLEPLPSPIQVIRSG
jgi:hypothetical protein